MNNVSLKSLQLKTKQNYLTNAQENGIFGLGLNVRVSVCITLLPQAFLIMWQRKCFPALKYIRCFQGMLSRCE